MALKLRNLMKEEKKIDKTIARYIPTGSEITTEREGTFMKVQIHYPISAPPLVTADIKGIERRLNDGRDKFVNDVSKVINIKKVRTHPYIGMSAENGKIVFSTEVALYGGNDEAEVEMTKQKMILLN